MYRRIFCGLLCFCLLGAFVLIPVGASQNLSEGFYYQVNDGEATVTGCSFYLSGHLTVPSVLDGYPVTAIGAGAFESRTGLTALTLPEGIRTIGDDAFNGCANLKELTLPNSLTAIGARAFRWCGMETVILPAQVTTIGDLAFYDNDKLRSITVPASVTHIGGGAFADCLNLPSVTVGEDHPYYFTDADGALYSKDQTRLCFVPQGITGSYRIPEGVTVIGDYALCYCERLQSVTIPDSVTTIGGHAFECCFLLTAADLPENLRIIGDSAFYGCTRLPGLTLPQSLTLIGHQAFYGCNRITEVHVPQNVTVIGDYAFYCCTDLTEVTLPDGLIAIGSMAFGHCAKLTAITFEGVAPEIEKNSFKGVTATAYYLACAEGWTEEVCQDYQGSLTWEGQPHRFPEQDPFGQCSCGAYKYALGDVTGDGQINIGDVAKLYHCIRHGIQVPAALGDVTGDGKINMGDVAKLFMHIRKG